MPSLTKKTADALCSVIALGFISANENASTLRDISSAGLITAFGYETADKVSHDKLCSDIRGLGLSIGGFSKLPTQTEQPFIVANDPGKTISTSGLTIHIGDNCRTIRDSLESELRAEKIYDLYGAYVGGYTKGELDTKMTFYGSSAVYSRKAQHRTVSTAELAEIKGNYSKASTVSNKINKILGDHAKTTFTKMNVEPQPDAKPFDASHDVFASCHGMTDALIRNTGAGICVELAFGESTTKVASCIPCSIFMTSKNKPASFTHLGRGDNWHFPEGHTPSAEWGALVKKCFDKAVGVEKIKSNANVSNFLSSFSGVISSKLPEIFLDALTFESSFINKINETFNFT